MRGLLVLAAALLLTASLAGCLERRGTLAIGIAVSDQGAIREFRTINLTLDKVRIDARTLNPETFPSAATRLELVNLAARGSPLVVFEQAVRADRYEKITLTTPPQATFQGVLLDGTTVAVVVANGVLIFQPDLDVPRGGGKTVTMQLAVVRSTTGTGAPTYAVQVDPSASRVT